MNWSRLVLITLGTGIVASLTDWFFLEIGFIGGTPIPKFGGKALK
jgi:hypothetical protein